TLTTAIYTLSLHDALPISENLGTQAAGIWTFSLGFRGLTPWRAARCCVENLPNPVNATSSRFFSASVIVSIMASTASPASRRPRSEEHTSELQSLAYLVCR